MFIVCFLLNNTMVFTPGWVISQQNFLHSSPLPKKHPAYVDSLIWSFQLVLSLGWILLSFMFNMHPHHCTRNFTYFSCSISTFKSCLISWFQMLLSLLVCTHSLCDLSLLKLLLVAALETYVYSSLCTSLWVSINTMILSRPESTLYLGGTWLQYLPEH
jgi:hypothetical protein